MDHARSLDHLVGPPGTAVFEKKIHRALRRWGQVATVSREDEEAPSQFRIAQRSHF